VIPPFEILKEGDFVDVNFHEGWYCGKEDVKSVKCQGQGFTHCLALMAEVVHPIFFPGLELKGNASKLMELLHNVMYKKHFHRDLEPKPE